MLSLSGGRLVARNIDDQLIWDTASLDLTSIVAITDLNHDQRKEVVAFAEEPGAVYLFDGLSGLVRWQLVGSQSLHVVRAQPLSAGAQPSGLLIAGLATGRSFVELYDFSSASSLSPTEPFEPSSVLRRFDIDETQLQALSGSPYGDESPFPLFPVMANFDGSAGGSLEMVIDRWGETYLWSSSGGAFTFELVSDLAVDDASRDDSKAWRELFVRDVDGDGSLELLSVGLGPNVHLAERLDLDHSAGTWTIIRRWRHDFSPSLTNLDATLLLSRDALTDIDGDGTYELLVSRRGQPTADQWTTFVFDVESTGVATIEHQYDNRVLLGTAQFDGDPQPELVLGFGTEPSEVGTLEVRDLDDNGNGLQDTLLTSVTYATADWLEPKSSGLDALWLAISPIAAVDVDGDGQDELFVERDPDGDGDPDVLQVIKPATGAPLASSPYGADLAMVTTSLLPNTPALQLLLNGERGDLVIADGTLSTQRRLTVQGLDTRNTKLLFVDLNPTDAVQGNLLLETPSSLLALDFLDFPRSSPSPRFQLNKGGNTLCADLIGDSRLECARLVAEQGHRKLLMLDSTGRLINGVTLPGRPAPVTRLALAQSALGKPDLIVAYTDTERLANQQLVAAWDPEQVGPLSWLNDGAELASDGTYEHGANLGGLVVADMDGQAGDEVGFHRGFDLEAPLQSRIQLLDGVTGLTLPDGDLTVALPGATSLLQLFDVDRDGLDELVATQVNGSIDVIGLDGVLSYHLDGPFLPGGTFAFSGASVNLALPGSDGRLRMLRGAATLTISDCTDNSACGAGQVCTSLFRCTETPFLDVAVVRGALLHTPGAGSAPLGPMSVVALGPNGEEVFLFGARDGYFYTVRATDGSLVDSSRFGGSVSGVIPADLNADGTAEIVVISSDAVLTTLGVATLAKPANLRDVAFDPTTLLPVAPQQDIDEAGSSRGLAATWTAVPGASGYLYKVRTSGGSVVVNGQVNAAGASDPSLVLDSLSLVLGQRYSVELQAVDANNGRSPVSVSDGVTVIDEEPPVVLNARAEPPRFNPDRSNSVVITADLKDSVALFDWSLVITNEGGTVVFEDSATIHGLTHRLSTNWWGEATMGLYTVTITTRDEVGLQGLATLEIVIDKVAPDPPLIERPAETERVGDLQPFFAGLAEGEPGGSVFVTLADGTPLCSAAVRLDEEWSCRSDKLLEVGSHEVVAQTVDVALNPSLWSAQRSFVIDTSIPQTPVILSPHANEVRAQGAVPVAGSAGPNVHVEVSVESAGFVSAGCVTESANSGDFVCSLAALSDGIYTLSATATNEIGLSSAPSLSVTFIVESDGDTDNDGMPDYWEGLHGFDLKNARDFDLDADSDGLDNLEEYLAGSDPRDADTDDDGVCDGNEVEPAADSDGDGARNVVDCDSDNDGLGDALEVGVEPCGVFTRFELHLFVPDSDPSTVTDPTLADTDGDSVRDGTEDLNHNGRKDTGEFDPLDGATAAPAINLFDGDKDGLSDVEERYEGTDPNDADSDDDGLFDGFEANWNADIDGDGLIDALDPDSDNDGVADATEVSLTTETNATDPARKRFRADVDPLSSTSMVLVDTDGDGLRDGLEDPNANGAVDPNELDPNDPTTAGAGQLRKDSDGDGLSDLEEAYLESRLGAAGLLINDADADDDGVLDGDEANWWDEQDGDGLANLLDFDSDNDCTPDGTELGRTHGVAGTDLTAGHFAPDANPNTHTYPLIEDSDGDGLSEAVEDANCNGRVERHLGESDPADPLDPYLECSVDDDCIGGVCQDGFCVSGDGSVDTLEPSPGDEDCSCSLRTAHRSSSPWWWVGLPLAWLAARRRRNSFAGR